MIPIAIVGIGAVFPKAGTARALWSNVRAGVDAITDVPPHRWDPEVYYDPDSYAGPPEEDRFYCRRGGFVDELATFDPARFGIAPAAVDGIEPEQLLALRTAAEAIADAGGEERLPDRSRVGVVIGRSGHLTPGLARYDQRMHTSRQLVAALADLVPDLDAERLERIRRAFCERLGPDRAETPAGIVPSAVASRIANRFDLHGPAYTVDAACASALLAVEHAVRALRWGQCDAVLAGAVHHAHHPTVWGLFSRLRALSPTGRIRPFDASADGTLLSEGTGMVLLKRLADAERDGDRIYAVIRGVACASDGRAADLLSPLVDGQLLAMRRAWREAGLDPRDRDAVGLIEAHGAATPDGDGAEVQALRRAFGTGGPPVALGTVKSQIGHALAAGGIAGLIKAAFALHEGILPPTLHVEDPRPGLAGTRFRLLAEPAEWEAVPGVPRRAAVNAFGLGGVNAHLVLEEPPASMRTRRPGRRVTVPEHAEAGVLRLAAEDPAALAALLEEPDEDLIAKAGTVVGDGPCRLAVAAPTPKSLAAARAVVAHGRPWRGRGDIWFTPEPMLAGRGRVAFLFPGLEPVFRPRIEGVAERFGLPRPELTGRDDMAGRALDVLAVGRLLAGALRAMGVEPDVVAGHGIGEWTAMIVAGVYSAEAAERFWNGLAADPPEVPDVIYAALGCGADRAGEAVADVEGVTVSHDNGPHQSIICGAPRAVREVLHRLGAEGVLGQELPFRSGFHSPAAAVYLDRLPFDRPHRPSVPLWSATTAAPFPPDQERIRDLAVRHLLEPIRFSELIERLYTDAGVRAFVQVGPGSLAGFATDRLGSREHLAVAANVPARDGLAQLAHVAAALWVEGYGSERAEPAAPAPAAPPPGMRLDLGTPLVRLAGAVPPVTTPGPSGRPDRPAWAARSGRPEPARAEPPAEPVGDRVMAEYQALIREATAGATAVLEAYGGGSPPAADPAVEERTERRVFSLETMPYLIDHCVVAQRAGWADPADRFPVVPLATLLEVMADAARGLLPGRVVTAMTDVRAPRWVTAAPPTEAAVRARLTGPGRVEVTVDGHAEAVVWLADRYPDPPAPDRTPLTGEGPPAVTAERLYSERWMFHGPRFQGVREIDALAGDGLRGAVVALPAPGALLDAAGQLCSHWIQVYGDRDQVVFPVGVERVAWYGPHPAEGERLEVTVRNRAVDEETIRCDAELIGPDGAVRARVEGWTARRFHTDELLWRMRFTPELSGVGEPQPGGWCLARRRWDDVPSRDLLMRHYLCTAERAEYRGLPPHARGSWLLGRIAVKDAVRHWLWEQGHGPLFPAELTVRTTAEAADGIEVTGPFTERLAVSVACSDDLAAALVRPAPGPVGIELAPPPADGPAATGPDLTEEEQVLLERLAARPDADRAAEAARLQAAKRAAAEAAGADPRDVVVSAADGDRLLAVAGRFAAAVQTRVVDGHLVAWTVAPPSAGEDRPPAPDIPS
ncbi:beta-ketoacyl synthase N-terminal-like domain-containing protein [Thermomonospora catenispora]|uniref:beta-ketoacyl synthase N-terminal-like domain-containing protein n=1 Tax=Thermomonospora catenispora TaxID=2493090 RepID=UPI0011225749|nr:beta-ketoacyl synthase N-terminal-like domain-containing protein [Thermomonospora catenispora]TNY34775.1 acyltransferase domain-containing protein [Thermomonospora catenispora]